jgi:hypothetical protein
MGFDIGAFHKNCAKSCLGAAEEHAKLAKFHQRLANKSTSDDDHANIATCHERLADHCADLAHQHTQAAKALGGIDTHDDSTGIHSLTQATGAGPGKFGMFKAMDDDEFRSRVIPPQKSETPDLSKVPAELADIFRN